MCEKNSKDFNEYISTATPDVQILDYKQIQEKFPGMRTSHNPNLVGMWD
jgi:hypothetical protein